MKSEPSHFKSVAIRCALKLLFLPLLFCIMACAQDVNTLIQQLGDKNPNVQMSAAKSLVKAGTVAVAPLIAVLKDDNSAIRAWAAYALGEIRDAHAVEPLILSLKDKSSNVREVAATALDKLGWKPNNTTEEGSYCVAKMNWDWCKNLGASLVIPLRTVLSDGVEWIDDNARVSATLTLLDLDKSSATFKVAVAQHFKCGDLNSTCRINIAKGLTSGSFSPLAKTNTIYKIKKGIVIADEVTSVTLPESIEAKNINELSSIVLINYHKTDVGFYISRHEPFTTASAYKYRVKVVLIDWNSKHVIKEQIFWGNEPPISTKAMIGMDISGSKPDDEITKWISYFIK